MAMWQHMFGVYVWHSVCRCKLDCGLQSNLHLHTERSNVYFNHKTI